MKRFSGKNNLLLQLLSGTAALLIFSCTITEKRKIDLVKSRSLYTPPVTVLLDTCPTPKIIELKNVPPPRVVFVPKVPGGTYRIFSEGREGKIELKLPVVTKASLPVANFTNFNTDDGLALDGIVCGLQDRRGQLWFGTNGGGVSRYDGAKFTTFTAEQGLTNGSVRCMIEDRMGNLWLGTQGGGVSRFDGTRFTTFTTREGLADNYVLCLAEDSKGILWFGTQEGGVSRYDGNRFTILKKNGLLLNPVNAIEEDKNGYLWFGTYGGGIGRYDPAKGDTGYTTFTVKQGLASNYVWSIMEDTRGNLWFGTQDNGVSRYDGTGFTTFEAKRGLVNNSVHSIMEDKTGNLWFGTFDGLSKYDGTNFTSFTTDQGLSSNIVNSITKDKSGNLWIGTAGGGVNRYNGSSISMFNSNQGLAKNNVGNIIEDKSGNLWFAPYGSGVCRYDGTYFTTFTMDQGLAQNIVLSIEKDTKGNIWFGTYEGGVSSYNGNSFTTFTTSQGLGDNTIVDILEDKRGNLWFGTIGGGVSLYDGKGFTTYTTSQGLASNVVKNILEDESGNLWFGTEGGVSRYDGTSFTNFTVEQGLAHNSIFSSLQDISGNLWFGTEGGGVSRYDGSGFMSFTTRDGLADGNVYGIVEDRDGTIWMGTNQGLSGLKFNIAAGENNTKVIRGAGLLGERNEKLESYEPVWEIYNSKTGYPIKDLNLGAVCITKSGLPLGNKDDVGVIWGGCSGETVIRFDPKAVIRSSEKPVVFFQSIEINETSLNWYSLGQKERDSILVAQQEAMVYRKSLTAAIRDSLNIKFGDILFDSIIPYYQLPQNLILPYWHNRIRIDFGAIETTRNFMVRYQYLLEGYDNDWSPVTENTSASFGNISEGTYTFKLKARSPEGIWSEAVSYSFKVLPPWWRTWWFRTIMGIVFLFLLYGIYRWRTAALRKQKRVLEQTVKERTAEVTRQKEKSDELLLNILPSEVAEELKVKGYTTAKTFDEVTVLFSDIKGFTEIAEKMTAQELVKEIDTYFSTFDYIIQKYGVEKIKTIGDAYIAAGGLSEKNSATAHNVVEAAIAMQQAVEVLKQERASLNKPYFELRIGIHTGTVVAGVVGKKKFQYDIWGDTVNLAARMEQSGLPGKINISQHTYELVKEQFTCIHRGKIDAKNKGSIDMYFADNAKIDTRNT